MGSARTSDLHVPLRDASILKRWARWGLLSVKQASVSRKTSVQGCVKESFDKTEADLLLHR